MCLYLTWTFYDFGMQVSLIVLVVIAVVVESHASSDVGAQRLGRVIFSF